MKQLAEILAPAGDFDTLKAAAAAGADAVYLGGERFGARAFAKNFTEKELCQAIDYMHLRGKKLYLTVNTLVKEREFAELYDYLSPYYQEGLDAVIVQDLGVMDYIRRQFPGLSIHASTQMTVTNVISAAFLERQGVERVVPARELSLQEIQEIREKTGLEIECFVHGALCYSYSGQCLLSSLIGGRSGNRGQCAQPCRLPYGVEGGKPQDILSLKDLSTLEFLPELLAHGIDSFKIEGRMKQPTYVATVTELYRRYLDLYAEKGEAGYQVRREDLERLEQAYQRRGYCGGYYHIHNGRSMLSLERPEGRETTSKEPELLSKRKICGILQVEEGKPLTLKVTCQEAAVQVKGARVQKAEKAPISEERLKKQMQKTGNTPFAFEKLEIQIKGSVFLPIQSLNEVRRQALEQLEEALLAADKRQVPERLPMCQDEDGEPRFSVPELTASVGTLEQLEEVVSFGRLARVYVEDFLWTEKNKEPILRLIQTAHTMGMKVYFSMARIYRKEAERYYDVQLKELMGYFDGVLVRNLESALLVRRMDVRYPMVTDHSIYLWNKRSKAWCKALVPEMMTAPIELNSWEMEELGIQNMELSVYGYLPVMITAGCIRKNTSGCDKVPSVMKLTDRQKKKLAVQNVCRYCYNIIYNAAPLMLTDQQERIRRLSPGALRLQFTTEPSSRVRELLELFYQAGIEGRECSISDTEYTRGHFKRGVK